MYFVKTPWWLKKLYPHYIWEIPVTEKILYVTFDDGPHETATLFALDQLRKYHAQATFFCVGKNVREHPEIYKQIIEEGHTVGNHTYNHLNGWKTTNKKYVADILEAANYIDSHLFRPPYGRISRFQANILMKDNRRHPLISKGFKIIMWSVLSGDFDLSKKATECRDHVLLHARPGSIVVFHDSKKAWDRMQGALPEVLKYFSEQGFQFKSLPYEME
ncbi:MAG: polysaccharide deacetylase family protein [Bacteroidetes bacterium]|nr:polysaccharide deacetylase family protein [Bacteroidota bacterium]